MRTIAKEEQQLSGFNMFVPVFDVEFLRARLREQGEEQPSDPPRVLFTATWLNHSQHRFLRTERSMINSRMGADEEEEMRVKVMSHCSQTKEDWIPVWAPKHVLFESSLLFHSYFKQTKGKFPFFIDNYTPEMMKLLLEFMGTGSVRADAAEWQKFAQAMNYLQVGAVYPEEFEYQVEFSSVRGDDIIGSQLLIYNRKPWRWFRPPMIKLPVPRLEGEQWGKRIGEGLGGKNKLGLGEKGEGIKGKKPGSVDKGEESDKKKQGSGGKIEESNGEKQGSNGNEEKSGRKKHSSGGKGESSRGKKQSSGGNGEGSGGKKQSPGGTGEGSSGNGEGSGGKNLGSGENGEGSGGKKKGSRGKKQSPEENGECSNGKKEGSGGKGERSGRKKHVSNGKGESSGGKKKAGVNEEGSEKSGKRAEMNGEGSEKNNKRPGGAEEGSEKIKKRSVVNEEKPGKNKKRAAGNEKGSSGGGKGEGSGQKKKKVQQKVAKAAIKNQIASSSRRDERGHSWAFNKVEPSKFKNPGSGAGGNSNPKKLRSGKRQRRNFSRF